MDPEIEVEDYIDYLHEKFKEQYKKEDMSDLNTTAQHSHIAKRNKY